MTKFTIEEIQDHFRRRHPGCPAFAVAYFTKEIAAKSWEGCKLGMAVGITLQTFLRHNMTDYDQLLLEGVERAEAKRRVQPSVNKMIALWEPVGHRKSSK